MGQFSKSFFSFQALRKHQINSQPNITSIFLLSRRSIFISYMAKILFSYLPSLLASILFLYKFCCFPNLPTTTSVQTNNCPNHIQNPLRAYGWLFSLLSPWYRPLGGGGKSGKKLCATNDKPSSRIKQKGSQPTTTTQCTPIGCLYRIIAYSSTILSFLLLYGQFCSFDQR